MKPNKAKSTQHRQAALARWAQLDESARREATRPGRTAFLNKFEDAPNPNAALRLHMSTIRTTKRR
jgi:hypothetical protein